MRSLVLLTVMLTGFFLAGAQAAPASSTPVEVKATYKVLKNGIWIGTVEEQFLREGDTYKIKSETASAGALNWFLRDRLIVSVSGKIDLAGLQPTTYDYSRQSDNKKGIHAQFDWEKNQIISTREGKTETFDLPAGTQDRISAMYQFMFAPPRTVEVTVVMSQGKKAEPYRYRKQGEPVLKTNAGELRTVHYKRDAKEGESKAELWLARDRYYLPVRIIFTDPKGVTLEQALASLETR